MIAIDETAKEFTALLGTCTAILRYRRRADRFIITHTVVPPEARGAGIGGQLVTAAIEYAVQRGLTVVPLCPFARSWLRSHPAVADRAAIDWSTSDRTDPEVSQRVPAPGLATHEF